MGAVVVTYFPDDAFASRLASVTRECAPVLVVDNSVDESVRARLRAVCASHGAGLVEQPENSGIGRALNDGFRALAAEGLEWAVAFDQDSTPAPGFVAALLAARASPDREAVIVGANWRDAARPDTPSRHLQPANALPFLFRRLPARIDLHETTCVITSGTLFHLPTILALGAFDETLFLDLVDAELCLRARAAGQRVHVAAAARLIHHRGDKRPVRFAGRTWWPAFMGEERLYLLFRNRVLVFRRHGRQFPHWVTFEIVFAVKVAAEILFLEDRKSPKLAACWRGTWHGLRAARGKAPAAP